MTGVTLASPNFASLAWEASRRFQEFTGLPCTVIRTTEERNYAQKLDLAEKFDETVVWFDADLWFIRKCDLTQFDACPEILGVRDPGIHDLSHFPFHDCRTLKLDVLQYFNTGLFIWDSRNKHHLAAFKEARGILASYGNALTVGKLKDFGEQSALNAGAQRKAKVRLISNSFNYIPFGEFEGLRGMVPRFDPATVHAAGYTYDDDLKLKALQYFAAKYTNQFGDNASYSNHPTA